MPDPRQTVRGLLVLALLVSVGCARPAPQAAPVKPTTAPNRPAEHIKFGKGFHGPEKTPDESFRWMGPEGVVQLFNYQQDAVLKIGGRPSTLLKTPPTVRVFFNDELLDEFPAPPTRVDKQYTIPAAKQGPGGWSELKITASDAVVPAEHDAKSKDTRALGFRLSVLSWEPKGS